MAVMKETTSRPGGGHGKPFVRNFVLHGHAAPGGWGYPPDPLNKGAWCLTNGGAGRGHTRRPPWCLRITRAVALVPRHELGGRKHELEGTCTEVQNKLPGD